MNNSLQKDSYYGWIPILTSTLQADYFIGRLKTDAFSKKLEGNQFVLFSTEGKINQKAQEIFGETTRSEIQQKLSYQEGEVLFYLLENLDDKNADQYDIGTFIVNGSYVREVGIFSTRDLNKFSLATIELIGGNGLVKYQLKERGFLVGTAERAIFNIIRNIYHDHIYANHADSLLTPILAEKEEDAIKHILDSYKNKIIKYHKSISAKLSMSISDGFNNRKLLDVHEETKNARGEIIHSLNFVKLFYPDSKIEESSLEVSLKSIENLLDSVHFQQNLSATNVNFQIFSLTFIVTGITIFFLMEKIGQSFRWALFEALAASIFISAALPLLYAWYTRKIGSKE